MTNAMKTISATVIATLLSAVTVWAVTLESRVSVNTDDVLENQADVKEMKTILLQIHADVGYIKGFVQGEEG